MICAAVGGRMSGYSKTVTELALNPRYAGDLSPCDATGLMGTPGNGRFLKFTALLDGSRITDIGFTTYGCGPCIAAGSMMATMVLGKSLASTATISRDDLLAALGGLPDDKLHCADMALAAWHDLLTSALRGGTGLPVVARGLVPRPFAVVQASLPVERWSPPA